MENEGDGGNQVIARTLGEVAVGDPIEHEGLALYPLLGAPRAAVEYLTLAEALGLGGVRITEISEGGSVPELAVVNDGERPVLLVDGEELVGAKQNRVLNLTVLVPGRSKLVIPVSCVEQGRWTRRSAQFAHEDRTLFSQARSKKAARVTENLVLHCARHADQGEIWDDVADKVRETAACAPSMAMSDAFAARRVRLGEYREALRPVEGQCGAVFAVRGKVAGLDLFDRPATYAGMHDKLVGSYAMDADGNGGPAAKGDPKAFLLEVAAVPVRGFAAVGLGRDLRLAADRVAGGGLDLEGRLVHLCAFRIEGRGGREGTLGFASRSRRARGYRAD